MLRERYLCCFYFTVLCTSHVLCYKPVIIIHGILDKAKDMEDLAGFIRKAHPGTNITIVDMYEEIESLTTALWTQVHGMGEEIRPVMQQAKDGVHIIGFSQGGLVARGIIQTMSDHNVDSFISLSAPLMGQFGDTSYLKPWVPTGLRKDMYKFFYTELAQKKVSVANYWNDPYHEPLNMEYNVFLPVLNNNQTAKFYNKSASGLLRENFIKINNLILVGGPDDGVITPWQSAHFGFYNKNLTVVGMKEQQVYIEDTFGLQTLDKRSAIHTYTFPGIHHVYWHRVKKVFDAAVEPWLT